jgi:pilus assembly protein CpaE
MEQRSHETTRFSMHTQAPLITVVSASGGTGKSTIALLASFLAAGNSISTALLEGDLQFGDMGFWLGLDTGLSNLSQGAQCIPTPVSNHLVLYKGPVLPEVAESVSDEVALLVPQIREKEDLVIADTGQFWSGLTGDLLCTSDLVLLIMDQRESSIYGAIKAFELCQRLGIPAARITCVINRALGKTKSERDRLHDIFETDDIFWLGDGKSAVEALVGTGRVEEFLESGTAPLHDIESLLTELFPRIGLAYAPPTRKKARRLFP